MARTERKSNSRREEKWQTCWCCRDQQRACRMAHASAEKLEHTGPAKRKEWPQYAGAALAKNKRNRAVCPEYQILGGRESRGARVASWQERGGSEQKHEEEKVHSTVNKGRFQGGEEGQARRASLEEVEGSMCG